MNEKEINEFLEQFDTFVIAAKKDRKSVVATKGATIEAILNIAKMIELVSEETGKPAKFLIDAVMSTLEIKKASSEVFNEKSTR